MSVDHEEFAETTSVPDKADPNWEPNDKYDNANHEDYKEFTLACIQHNVSIQASVDLFNGLLRDKKEGDVTKYITRKKMQGQFKKYGKELERDHEEEMSCLEVLGVD